MLKHAPLVFRFTLSFLAIILLIGSAYFLVLRQVYFEELVRQSRNIADNVDAFGKWVAQYGRVWVKDSDSLYLSKFIAVDKAAATANDTAVTSFYSKNPALAQREFSEMVAKSNSKAKFRMTSDNWMNPSNKPDDFEAMAIATIKARKLDEYTEFLDGKFRYARKIVHAESCIKCHGSPASAPRDVTDRYGTERGYGFQAGDIAGVISVTLPTEPLLQASLSVFGPAETSLILLAFVVLYLFLHYGVLRPIRQLTQAAEALSMNKRADIKVGNIPPNTRNEIEKLMAAIDRFATSTKMAIKRMKEGKPSSIGPLDGERPVGKRQRRTFERRTGAKRATPGPEQRRGPERRRG